jgi:protein-tyrosine phosphatase
MRDRIYDDCNEMIASTLPIAKDLHKLLCSGKKVLVHCHAGQNRAAFCICIMSAKYKLVPTFDEFMIIMHEDNAKRGIKLSLVNFNMKQCVQKYWNK